MQLAVLACVAIYGLMALWAYWPVSPLSGNRLILCGCYDPAQHAWFLAWTPFAILHGLNPFWTDYINYPNGVNLAANTSMPLLGVLAAPITLTLGPVAALNLLLRLAFFASAGSMFWVLRRFGTWLPAAFVGGLLYGYSPYMMGQGGLHLNLVFVPIPPLLLYWLEELIVAQRRSPRRTGLVIGFLASAQYLISSEVFADSVLVAVIAIGGLTIVRYHGVIQRVRHVLEGSIWALVPFALICGYPIWYSLEGPQHIIGPTLSPEGLSILHSDLLGLIVPTTNQRLGPSWLQHLGSSYSAGNSNENGSYLGLPLVILLGSFARLFRSRPRLLFMSAMVFISFVLMLGTGLTVDGHNTGIPLPYALIAHLPFLANVISLRFSLFVDLFAAVALSLGIHELHSSLRPSTAIHGHSVTHQVLDRARAGAVVFGVAFVGLLPLVPSFPYYQPGIAIPLAFFRSSLATKIPQHSVVLTYPYPLAPENEAMLWQAEARLRFKLIGSYALVPAENGGSDIFPPVLPPSSMEELFNSAMNGANKVGPPPPFDATTTRELRQFCESYDVDTILVEAGGGLASNLVIKYLNRAFGLPTYTSRVFSWYHIQKELDRYRHRGLLGSSGDK